MSALYKLTTHDGWTRRGKYNACQWGEGVTHSGTGEGPLCGDGWIHAYTHPLLAALLNPAHARIDDPILWECEGEVVLDDRGLKVGCRSLTTLRRIPLPPVSITQRARFAVLCALDANWDPAWRAWARAWLDGSDRSQETAKAVRAAASGEALLDLIALAERAIAEEPTP